ncbi:MAG: hypothetical protein LBF85_06550, partial [Tannerella sp.]|nr:hypothetical protein [Tannerella sp.]
MLTASFFGTFAMSFFGTWAMVSCDGGAKKNACPDESTPYTVATMETFVEEDSVNGVPAYTILEITQVDLNAFPKDANN